MTWGMLFWVIYIISILFGGWSYHGQPGWPRTFLGVFVLWILIGILGWHVFGPVVR